MKRHIILASISVAAATPIEDVPAEQLPAKAHDGASVPVYSYADHK